jgi:hypothetical protein
MNASGERAHHAAAGTTLVLPARIRQWLAASLVVLSAALFLVGLFLFRAHAQNADLARLQWAGSSSAANTITGLGGYGRFRVAIYWDLGALVPGFTLGLVAATVLGWCLFWARAMQRAALAALRAAIAAGAASIVQDVLLLSALSQRQVGGDWILRFAAAASFIRFSLFLVAAVVGSSHGSRRSGGLPCTSTPNAVASGGKRGSRQSFRARHGRPGSF